MAHTAQTAGKPSGQSVEELEAVLRTLVQEGGATQLEGYREKIFLDRYALKDSEGQPLETHPEEMWLRVAKAIASVETDERRTEWTHRFYDVLKDFRFVPGGRILSGAGSGTDVTYYNCFVIASPEDSVEGIFKNIAIAADIMRRSGGVGVNLSSLRPRGAYIRTVNGTSSGPCSWGILYSDMTGKVIIQGGSRRGALMLMLDDDHPDIEEFIEYKRKNPGHIDHANLSVAVSDTFMQAVKDDADWDLKWQGKVWRTVRARDLWHKIAESAHAYAEPGVVFVDRYNKRSNTWFFENIRCVNPCVTGDTLVSTETGYVPARDLQVGLKIRTPKGLQPIEKVYNNGVQKIYRIEFSDGGHLDCTYDHKLKVVRGHKYQWVPVADLGVGDTVLVMPNEAFGERKVLPEIALEYIAKQELNVSDRFDRRLGLAVGVVLGDGAFRNNPTGNSFSYECTVGFDSDEHDWIDTFTSVVTDMGVHTHRTDSSHELASAGGVATIQSAVTVRCYKLATLMAKLGLQPNKIIPEHMLETDKEFLAGLLDGLFSADGNACPKADNPMLRLRTSSRALAEQIRLLLLRFGIHGRIYATESAEDLVYDGRSMYGTGTKFDVVVMNEGIARFYSEIGLSHPKKAAKLKEMAENRHFQGTGWTAAVTSISDTGREEDVFDLYEPETLTFVTNGYVSFDCGEQGLPAWGVCNLGAMNLVSFVKNRESDSLMGETYFDFEDLAQATKTAIRFLDDVIDATNYPFPENREAQQNGARRTGLGTMGIADVLIKLGLRYGSEEAMPILDQIYRTIRDAAYESSAGIAAEKGAFPPFDREKYMAGEFIKELPQPVQEKIADNGIRNAVLLTQAPTGTTSSLAGVNSGIEPVFAFITRRRDRLGEHVLYHPLAQEWKNEHPDEPLPDYFVASGDLTPHEHVHVQAMVQRYTDSSISKTVNGPATDTVEFVEQLYLDAYDLGCKGVTYYRQGSRDAVLEAVTEQAAEKVAEKITEVQPVPASPAFPATIKPRPQVVSGYTRQIRAPEGKVNLTLNSDESGLLEVFINLGKAGTDIAAMAEALGRLISLNLQMPSPMTADERVWEMADQLRNIGGSRTVGFGPGQVKSLPDALGQALLKHLQREGMQETNGNRGADGHATPVEERSGANGNGGSAAAPAPVTVQQLLEKTVELTGNLCPGCGCNSLVYQEGCRKCYTCGHSEC